MEALLEFRNVSKAFGNVKASDSVSFSVVPGRIHALVGENGAGKSTIVKILFGLYRKDSGEIFYQGKSVDFPSALMAKRKGIGMVHQHFMLAAPMTALDHLFLDESSGTSLTSLLRPLRHKAKLKEAQDLSARYQMPVPWEAPIERLSVGIQQRIEILKLLHNKADVLILDEPTAVLTPQEVQSLFKQLKDLKAQGKTILLITHKLKEVMALADEVTVFRRGQALITKKISETSAWELAELMVGRKLQNLELEAVARSHEPALEIKQLSDRSLGLKNLNLRVQSREIVGIAGIEGNGQSELIQVLLNPGSFRNLQGHLLWKDRSIRFESAASLKEMGFSYFPEDRLHQGALMSSSVLDNFILGQHRDSRFQTAGWMNWSRIRNIAQKAIENFDVRPADPDLTFQNLSGGNQQKLVVARELDRKPEFLLAAQPTRGVDIGAIERIHSEILRLRKSGGSILLISSDLDELMKLSDRIVVLFQGQFVGELSRLEFNEMILGRMMAGVAT